MSVDVDGSLCLVINLGVSPVDLILAELNHLPPPLQSSGTSLHGSLRRGS